MDAVARAVLYSVVKVFQLFLAIGTRFKPIVFVRPAFVRQRKAREIEAPFSDKGEVAFLEGWVAAVSFDTFFREIESAPARQTVGGRFGQVLGIQGESGAKANDERGGSL